MEQYFGTNLIDKTHKSLTLTQQGQKLLQHAKKIVTNYSSLRGELNNINGKVNDKLLIGTTYIIGMYIIPPYISDFLRSSRSTKIQLMYYSNHEKICEDLMADVIDVGIIEGDIKSADIKTHAFGEEELVIISSKMSKLYGNKEIDPFELENMAFVKFLQNSPNRNIIDNILSSNNINTRTSTEFDNIDLIKCAVEANLGPSIVPISSVYMELDKQVFYCSRIKDTKMPCVLSFFYKKDSYVTSAMNVFFAILKGDINFLHIGNTLEDS
jgi:DNA-binding transcriptional LysR family regulator